MIGSLGMLCFEIFMIMIKVRIDTNDVILHDSREITVQDQTLLMDSDAHVLLLLAFSIDLALL
jgi:hypothetical protein